MKNDSTNECTTRHLPTMIVFDLDDCLWTPEMHELSGPPTVPIEGPLDPDYDKNNPMKIVLGTIGMGVPRHRRRGYNDEDNVTEVVTLYDGARRVLRELATNPTYGDVVIAVASSSLEPSYSWLCLKGIDVLPDLTMADMISHAQIGREGVLTSRKTTHFCELQKATRKGNGGCYVPYTEMLFFDDCNWSDHVGDLESALGVTGVRTPNGLTMEEFHAGLELYSCRT